MVRRLLVVLSLGLASAAHATEASPVAAPPANAPKPATELRFRPGGGLQIATADHRYSLSIGARMQLQYVLLGTPGDDGRDLTHTFQIRRARLLLGGALFDGKVKYKLELGFSPRDMGMVDGRVTRAPVFDGWVASEHLRDLSVKAGQFKVPFSHEFVISTGSLQMVDLSGPTNEFALDFDLGAMLYGNDVAGAGKVRWFAALTSGEGHSSTAFTHLGLLAVGRVELFPLGMWDDYVAQSNVTRDRQPHLALGGAFAYQKDAHHERGVTGPVYADGGTADLQHATADLVFDVAGVSVEGAFFWRHGTRSPGGLVDADDLPVPAVPVRNGLGLQAQAGWLLPRIPVEVATQFSQIRPLGDDSAIQGTTSAITAGVSVYVQRHATKLQVDYARQWTDRDVRAGSDQLRAQLQLTL